MVDEGIWEIRKLKIIMKESKILKFSLSEEQAFLRERLRSKELEDVREFKFLGSVVAVDGSKEAVLKLSLGKGAKIMLESIVVPILLYGPDSWVLIARERMVEEVLIGSV